MALTVYYGLHGLMLLAAALSIGWRLRRGDAPESIGNDFLYICLAVGLALAALVPAVTWLPKG